MLSISSILLALTASVTAQVISSSCQCGRREEDGVRITVRLHNQDTEREEERYLFHFLF